jgi:hypothetical protein
MDAVEIQRVAELRHAIAEMQAELPPQIRVSGPELRSWQNEAVQIYLECRRAARAGVQSPYAQGRLRAWERTA